MDYSGLPERVAHVQETIARHQQLGGWSHPVMIVAVVKAHGPDAVRAATAAGLTAIGENRVQEALTKMAAVPDAAVEWHLIGTLQRNKVRHVIGKFALIHTVDRPELVAELVKRIPPGGTERVLIEVNCGAEVEKAGVAPEGLQALVELVERHDVLRLEGLMTMGPLTHDPEAQRAPFRRLRELRDGLAGGGPQVPHLSMGMSNDYPVAVEEGATIVRLGTVLFGERSA
ncbi:MAG TPA: YggS family pyridoxal phosphate-dependent enzyme [Gemmatimonadales bacterium]